jgi:hypothetical protein
MRIFLPDYKKIGKKMNQKIAELCKQIEERQRCGNCDMVEIDGNMTFCVYRENKRKRGADWQTKINRVELKDKCHFEPSRWGIAE